MSKNHRIMDTILLIIVGYFFLRICWKLFRSLMSRETAAIWLVSLGLMLAGLQWIGFIILAWRYLLVPIGRCCERRERSRRRKGKDAELSNETVMWLVPIFWPFLIAKWLLKDKPRPNDNTPYDYEQFKKTNGK